ncbi:MAG: sulfite exporter TauE/SafE family protein [Patescibacteria group bacterium]
MKNKLIIPIAGLHCKACEILTEDSLKEIKNVEKAKVNHRTGLAEITYEGEAPKLEDLAANLKAAGYDLGDTLSKSAQKKDFSYFISIFAGVIIIYWLLNKSNVLDFGGLLKGDFSWPLAILVGLVAGVSTCLALVGGLVFSLATNYAKNHPEASSKQKFIPHVIFNLGRIVGFFLLGGILGLLGSTFKMSPILNSIIALIIGLVILVLGLKLLDISPSLNRFDFSLPKRFGKIVKIESPLLLGALTFFLPCGFTQAMQVYALGTGSFVEGGLIMALFALGTVPGLLGIGGISALASKKKSKNFFIIAGVFIVAFGLFNLVNGYRLFRISAPSMFNTISNNRENKSNPAKNNNLNLEMENGVRVIRMQETNRGYIPNSFVILKGQPVKWVIDAKAPYSCASAIVVPSLDIQTNLKAGENIIEFTPSEKGTISFSCSMGMYTGKFLVVENEADLR